MSCVTEQKKGVQSKKTKIDDPPIMSFPLDENQLGYMNLSLQKFLGFKNRDICYTKKSGSGEDKRLKQQRTGKRENSTGLYPSSITCPDSRQLYHNQ